MQARHYVLVCNYCDEYTALNRHVPEAGRFQGEYSLLHNRHLDSDRLLAKFLLAHLGHPVRLVPDRSDDYNQIVARFRQFAAGDIDRYVEEAQQHALELQRDRAIDRSLGQLQLHILMKLLQGEAEALARMPSAPPHSQFLLGKQMGVEWALHTVRDLLRRGEDGPAAATCPEY